jgi:hypothetical protein
MTHEGQNLPIAWHDDLDDVSALGFLQTVYRSAKLPLSVRMRAATIAIQYESPRLQATAILRDDNAFAAQLERALMRSAKVIELNSNEDDRP